MFPSDSLLNLTDVLNFIAASLQKMYLSVSIEIQCSPEELAASHLITLRGYC